MGTAAPSLRDQLTKQAAEIAALRAELSKMRAAYERSLTVAEKVVAANAGLAQTIKKLTATITKLEQQLRGARGLAANAPTAPSGQIPTHLKPPAKVPRKGRGKPGRKAGHVGAARAKPAVIDRSVEQTTTSCPHCDGRVSLVAGPDFAPVVRLRYVEDILPGKPETTECRIHQYWCRGCQKRVEPAVVAALPGSRLGLRVVVQSAWQHYGLGIPTTKVVKLLRKQHGFTVTASGLLQAWRALSELLKQDYEALVAVIRQAGALHADESGWRVNGAAHWLWCFCTKTTAVYLIDESRGGEVAREVIGESFDGTLIRDFYAAYNACSYGQTQYCVAHLLREFKKIEAKATAPPTADFRRFRRRVCRVFGDAIKWKRKETPPLPEREAARERFERRLLAVLEEPHDDPDVVRLVKRLWRSADGLFTFVTEPDVEPTNNWAELNIRPAVVMRKNSYGNRSSSGADTQAILMSLARTSELRGEDVIEALMRSTEARIIERHHRKYDPVASNG